MLSTFETRMATLLKGLDAAGACDSAETAFAQFNSQWLHANEVHDSPARMLEYLRSRRMCEEQGWQGLGTEVAYLDCNESPETRVHLHRDGTIVIQRITAHSSSILYSKPGRPRKAPQAHAEDALEAAHGHSADP